MASNAHMFPGLGPDAEAVDRHVPYSSILLCPAAAMAQKHAAAGVHVTL